MEALHYNRRPQVADDPHKLAAGPVQPAQRDGAVAEGSTSELISAGTTDGIDDGTAPGVPPPTQSAGNAALRSRHDARVDPRAAPREMAGKIPPVMGGAARSPGPGPLPGQLPAAGTNGALLGAAPPATESTDETPTAVYDAPQTGAVGGSDGPPISAVTSMDGATSVAGSAGAPGSGSISTFASRSVRSAVPLRIGRYRIVRQIGEGGMGAVYLATPVDSEQPTPMALKVIRGGLAGEETIVRFRRERRVLSALDHVNIAKLLDAGETEEGDPYFVMEYVDGQSIDEYCDSHRLSVDERLQLLRAVCAAVHHAHQNLVVHRDIKPRNILVTADGVPKLLDFGIAKLISHTNPSGPDLPTAPEVRAMTPEYASPEQIRGLPVSTATDIYSLGVVMYELLCGRRPHHFTSRAMREVERTVCEVEPERPSEVVTRADQPMRVDDEGTIRPMGPLIDPEVVARDRRESPQKLRKILGRDLDNIVLMALRKEPQRRYSSAEAFAEDIRRHLEGHPVIAAPDTFKYRTIKFLTRHRVGVAATATVAAIVVIASVAFAWQWRVAVAQRDRADRRFEEVRALANVFLTDVYDAVNRLEGSTEARQLLVDNGLRYLDGLRNEAGGDRGLMEEIASGYHRLADVQGGVRGGNLGNTNGALASYQTAEQMRRELLERSPEPRRSTKNLAISIIGVADMMRNLGDNADATLRYHEAAELLESVVAADPNDAIASKALASALQGEGDQLFKRGEYARASEIFDRSIAIRRALVAADPTDADLQRVLATGLLRLGRLAELQGRPADALKHYTESLVIRQALADAAKSDARSQRDLLTLQRTVGDLHRDTGELEPALAQHQAAVKLAQRLADGDAKNARAKIDLALSRQSLGQTLVALDQVEEARAEFGTAVKLAEEAKQRDPKGVIASQAAAAAHEWFAAVLPEPSSAEAIGHLRRSLELWRELDGLAADENGAADARPPIDTARVAGLLGLRLVAAGAPAEARRLLDESSQLYAKLADFEPLKPDLAASKAQVDAALAAISGSSAGAAPATAPAGTTPK